MAETKTILEALQELGLPFAAWAAVEIEERMVSCAADCEEEGNAGTITVPEVPDVRP